MRGVRATQLGG